MKNWEMLERVAELPHICRNTFCTHTMHMTITPKCYYFDSPRSGESVMKFSFKR